MFPLHLSLRRSSKAVTKVNNCSKASLTSKDFSFETCNAGWAQSLEGQSLRLASVGLREPHLHVCINLQFQWKHVKASSHCLELDALIKANLILSSSPNHTTIWFVRIDFQRGKAWIAANSSSSYSSRTCVDISVRGVWQTIARDSRRCKTLETQRYQKGVENLWTSMLSLIESSSMLRTRR